MAKVVAPLLSFGGSGQIGKSIVFGTWRGIDYARRYVIPANPKSTSQTFQRACFGTLREIWKRLDTDGRAPWQSYASGRKFLGLNAFIGENRLSMGTAADIEDLIGSPGAQGGVPLEDASFASGSSSGEIDVDVTVPSMPTDWTITATVALALHAQAPDATLVEPPTVTKVTMATWDLTITGLTAGEDYVIAVWMVMTKADGSVAYSPSITGTATALA